MMLLSSLVLLFLPISSALAGSTRCIPSGDERPINEALLKGMYVHWFLQTGCVADGHFHLTRR